MAFFQPFGFFDFTVREVTIQDAVLMSVFYVDFVLSGKHGGKLACVAWAGDGLGFNSHNQS